MTGFTDIFRSIERISPKLSEWCPQEKAQTLACLVIALRPALIVEVGVWQGASLIPMALAVRAIGHGRIIAVDAWAKDASIDGQVSTDDVKWWSEVDYEKAYNRFLNALAEEGLSQFVEVVRCKSDEYAPPDNIGLWHCDGNHGDAAVRDVQKFAPKMAGGGVIVMDDYDWRGGAVRKACAALESAGWIEQYRLGTGGVWKHL